MNDWYDPEEQRVSDETLQQAEALRQLAETKLLAAFVGSESDLMLAEARDALIHAETLRPGYGAWRLACLAAHTRSHELCERWLRRAHQHGMLPEVEKLDTDPYLRFVRDTHWYRDFIESLGA